MSVADIEWIKIAVDTFEDEKVLLIGAMPDGDTMVVLWIRLICMAGKVNDGGVVRLADGVPFTDEMLATVLHRPISTIRLALNTFESLGMIHRDNQGIWLTNWDKHQNIDGMERIREQARLRKQRQRARMTAATPLPALPPGLSRDQSRDVTQQIESKNTEKERDTTTTAQPPIAEMSRDTTSLLSEFIKLPGWSESRDNHDYEWLSEFMSEFPSLTVTILRSCRDYHFDKKKHTKGYWKLRIRHWMVNENGQHGTRGGSARSLPKRYTPAPRNDRPLLRD